MGKNLLTCRRVNPMLRMGLLAGFLLLFSFCAVRAEEIRAPKVSLAEDLFDFKEIVEGEIINHSFTITNKGNETLKILQVKPG